MFNYYADTTKNLLTLAGCLAVIGTLALFSPQNVGAQGIGMGDIGNSSGSNYTPPRSGEPPSKQRRNQLCIE
ncbi:MAG: hypothetical protein OXF73_00670, partial [Gammaproteobacteria bacterium]|nr:hypothetical protein [Gammaproteobacteria bacterium]